MKKFFTYLLATMVLAFVGCSESFDDSSIWDKLNDHESRIGKLEELCKQMNTNISSLQTIVTALQDNDYVTGVTPITKDGKTIGYTITFTKSGAITIYHGEDGKDGQNGTDGKDGTTPVIGVKKASDGIYYWTLNGEWLLDNDGNKIKAVGVDGKDGADGENGQPGANGTDGKDGITPQLKIENDYWYVSYDNGATWVQLGPATGEEGPQGPQGEQGEPGIGGDSMFTNIDYSNENYVLFTLSNGTQIQVPTWHAFEQLQTLCNQMNTNISALQTIVTALQNNDYVQSITPLMENGKEVGYTILFSKSGTITIYHGKDGENGSNGENGTNGHTPQIGVKQDTDNIYYWTVDGEWLLDGDGNKIKAVGKDGADGESGQPGSNGTDGKDGITPKLKIENDYWFISYDNGTSWTQLGKATGEDGIDGADGDSFFKSVTQDENYVIFTLADGTEISVLKASSISSIKLSYVPRYDDGKATVLYTSIKDSSVELDFQVMPKAAATIIANDWQETLSLNAVSVITRAVDYIAMPISACTADATNGTITITASGENLPAEFFAGETKLRAALFYDATIGGTVSEYFELMAKLNKPANNEIWYTSSDGAVITPYKSEVFGANIVSNTYTNGKGVITFNGDVTKIGNDAFYSQLLTSVNIPDSVTQIEAGAFMGCYAIKEFKGKYAEDEGKVLVFNGTLIAFANNCGATEYVISEGITTIGEGAFYNCDNLKNITIGGDVITIGRSAFNDCSGLTDVTIPDNVTTLEYFAFGACNNLMTVTIGSGVKSITKQAFMYCDKLTSVYIQATTPPVAIAEYNVWDAFDYNSYDRKIYVPAESVDAYKTAEYWSNYDYAIAGYNFETGEVVVPTAQPANNEIWYTSSSRVTKSWSYATFGANIISHEHNSATGRGVITFDSNITTIGANAFEYTYIKSITIPNSVKTIGEYAFYNLNTLTSVTIGDGVTSIEKNAFRECRNLTSITIPNSVTSIGDLVFYGCSSLNSVTIDNNVISIGHSIFEECSSLTTFYGPLASDGGRCLIKNNAIIAYAEASGTTYTIPDGVTSIGETAFSGCSSLTSVTIPDSVTSIGEMAFCDCQGLTEVYCKATTPPTGGEYMFSYYYLGYKPIGCYIYVPTTSVSAYKAASYWSSYANYIVGYDF